MLKGKIGVELEHGSEWDLGDWRQFFDENWETWTPAPTAKNPRPRETDGWHGWEAGPDGSVSVRNGSAVEVTSRPTETTEKDLAALVEKVRFIYSKATSVNASCGLHFHLSFAKKADYWKLCSWDFVSKLQAAYLARFRADYEQNRAEARFCQFWSETGFSSFREQVGHQLSTREKQGSQRYSSVNFNAFNLYNTIEFRLFPGGRTFGKFREYMTWLLRFVSHYLRTAKDALYDVEETDLVEDRERTVVLDGTEAGSRELAPLRAALRPAVFGPPRMREDVLPSEVVAE